MINKIQLKDFQAKRNSLRQELSTLIYENIESTTYEGFEYSEADVADFILENIEELSKIINDYMKH